MMPKKPRALNGKIKQKTKASKKADEIDKWKWLTAVCGDYLSRHTFADVLEKSGLIENVTQVFIKQQELEASILVDMGGLSQQELDERISNAAKQFQEHLPKALYAGALIIATQSCRAVIGQHRAEKQFIRGLADWLFIGSSNQGLMADGRGRKSKIELKDVYQAIVNRGVDASRKGVAYDLNVSEKALNDWRKTENYASWKAAVNDILKRHERLMSRFPNDMGSKKKMIK